MKLLVVLFIMKLFARIDNFLLGNDTINMPVVIGDSWTLCNWKKLYTTSDSLMDKEITD